MGKEPINNRGDWRLLLQKDISFHLLENGFLQVFRINFDEQIHGPHRCLPATYTFFLVQALLLSSSFILNKSLDFYKLQFLHLQNGGDKNTCLNYRKEYGKNELIFNIKECYKLGSIIQI